MDSGTEITIALLAKKIDDQARFTRSVTIICTLAVLGVMFYTLTEVFTNLPQAVVLHYMANLEPIVKEWHAAESNIRAGNENRSALRAAEEKAAGAKVKAEAAK